MNIKEKRIVWSVDELGTLKESCQNKTCAENIVNSSFFYRVKVVPKIV